VTKRLHLLLPALLIAAAAHASGPKPAAPGGRAIAEPLLTPADAAAIHATCDRYLADAADLRRRLEADTTTPTLATFGQYDAIAHGLQNAGFESAVIAGTSPDAPLRDAARQCQERAEKAIDALELSPAIHARLEAIPVIDADAETRHVLARTLARFDRAGVARDAPTRARIAALNDALTALEIQFAANIANGRRTVTADPAELDGLPADYIAAHPRGADGKVVISTDYPDITPVLNYARRAALRQRLYLANQTRAWPENDAVLRTLLTRRDELAKALGRPDFATLVFEDRMLDSPARVRSFIDEVERIGETHARRDNARLLDRLERDQPDAGVTSVPLWDDAYLMQLIKKEEYDVDPQQVRRYFAYDNVRDGILQLTRDLMGVQIRPWKTATWHPAVETYEMLDGGKVIGRFYLDTHPRPGKFSHAAVMPIRVGVAQRSIPTAALVTNFPAGDHRTGLMEHRDVEVFLHEYGHLIHLMMSGGKRYALSSMDNLEPDFIEVPSKMLENFVWDYDTLARFAVDSEGNTIPRELVEKMNRARYFGEALRDRRQLSFANVALAYHLVPPESDLTAQYVRAFEAYSLQRVPAGAHPQASFPHLGGYSASYYTYMWSQTIALALFARFEKHGIRNPAVARAYREKILAPGGAKPAAMLVEDFLGQPVSLDAYRERLARGNPQPASQ
jgi:thimet oligopeptidase